METRTDDNKALFVSLIKPYNRLGISGIEIVIRNLGKEENINKVHPHKFRRTINKASGLEKELIKKGIIEEVITQVNHNMGVYDIVVFNIEKLKEYDSRGIIEYLKEYEKNLNKC